MRRILDHFIVIFLVFIVFPISIVNTYAIQTGNDVNSIAFLIFEITVIGIVPKFKQLLRLTILGIITVNLVASATSLFRGNILEVINIPIIVILLLRELNSSYLTNEIYNLEHTNDDINSDNK